MKPIQFECPHCREIIAGDESMYGQRVNCLKCQAAVLIPPAPAGTDPRIARLIQEPPTAVPPVPAEPRQEGDIFNLSPVVRAFPGQIFLGLAFIGLAVILALRAQDFSWPRWVALVPLAPGVLVLLLLWISVKSSSYRLTTERLFVRRGWLAKHVNELELYRVKDVMVDQGIFQRLLGYGTITVLADDNTTPQVNLVGISRPTTAKEMLRTQYRAARQREGVRPTEFLQSP